MNSTAASSPPAALASLTPLPLQTRWACHDIVGRSIERTAIRQEIAAAKAGRLAALTLEGEPGIGKSRLLVAVAEDAREEGFTVIAATADEEIRGPFLLARSLLAAPEASADEEARAALVRAVDAMSGRDDPELDRLSPDMKLLRVFDLAALAVRSLAARGPVALLVDDLQWSDEDSVRMLRYVVRSAADLPLLLVFAFRREESTLAAEVGALLADMERMSMVRRLELARLTQPDSAEVLKRVLGGDVDATTAATMHAQSEGVPFILEELAGSYRHADLLQQVDGVWRIGKKADRLLPSAVRTLIQRRATRLPAETRTALAEAAVLGRAFSLRDLAALRQRAGDEGAVGTTELSEELAPAVAVGLLTDLPERSTADYRFTHEHVREFAAGTLATGRRRVLHAAVVDMLTADGEPAAESLPLLARHALAAGDADRAARFAAQAAHAALAARAPEEALRLVELALPAVTTAQDRVALLVARDDALDMVRRPVERLESLAELGALAEALGDQHLLFDTMLRRASTLRLLDDHDRAAELADDVRRTAEEAGDLRAALTANLELGQAALRVPLGESFSPPGNEVDMERAAEAYERAVALSSELDDLGSLAAATRELGVLDVARARDWFVDLQQRGGHFGYLERIAGGERAEDVILETPIAPTVELAQARFAQAIGIFEAMGDRRGLMSSIIAMAYIPFALDIHLHGSAKRIEEIRRLTAEFASLAMESERDRADLQMLYGVHVFARAKGVVDLALSRGADAYHKSRILGDKGLEFASAGGVALANLDLGDVDAGAMWFDRAAAAAADAPLPFRTRTLALWRGMCAAAAGHADEMRRHLDAAVQMAADHGRPAARCEALARLALESARLGVRLEDETLLDAAGEAARQVDELMPSLSGRPLWGAQADAARALVALTRGFPEDAANAARAAMAAVQAADLEDLNLDIVLPAARALLAAGSEDERVMISMYLRMGLAMVSQRIEDEAVRVRWFQGPSGRELRELVGPMDPADVRSVEQAGVELDEHEERILRLLVQGRSNREIGEALGMGEDEVAGQLAKFYARIGTSSRAGATAFAFRERVI